jgi:hypothetical protein
MKRWSTFCADVRHSPRLGGDIGGYEVDSEELCSIDLNNVLKFVKKSGRFRDMT